MSFSAGGYLAGRLRSPWAGGTEGERHFRDGAHGFAVWAVGIVFGAAVLASGVSGVLKTATEIGRHGLVRRRCRCDPGRRQPSLDGAGRSGHGLPDAPGSGRRGCRSRGPCRPADARWARARPSSVRAPCPRHPVDRTSIARVFTANLKNDQIAARDRTYLAQVVARQTGMSQADAEKRVDEAYAEAKTAEQKARDLANEARKKAILIAFLTAATMAIACAAACVAAGLGAKDRDSRTGPYWMGAQRFW